MAERLSHLQNALARSHVPVLAELRAKPVLNQTGEPHVVAGNNAHVAQLRRTDGTYVALRIVALPGKDLDWSVRYASLAEFQSTRELTRLPGGIAILPHHAGWFGELLGSRVAVMAMDWIPGPTLLAGIDRATQAGNSGVIRALSAGFSQMWNDLQPLGFFHGDYSAQNILVQANGQLACVDLDTASWRDSPFGAAGNGTPGYRHPALNRDVVLRDGFAALVIVASLAALADNPSLRLRHGDPPSSLSGALLFRERDLANLQHSRAFIEARRDTSAETQRLLDGLAAASAGDRRAILDALKLVPRLKLSEEFNAAPDAVDDSGWDVAPIVARMRAHYTDSWDVPQPEPVEPVTSADQTWRRPSPPDTGWPDSTGGSGWGFENDHVLDEEQAVRTSSGDLVSLQAALDRNDEAEVIRIWAQIGDAQMSALVRLQVETVLAASYERRIGGEARQGRDQAVVTLAEEAAERGIPLGIEARNQSRLSVERIEVRNELESALGRGDTDLLADMAMSGRLVVLGDTDRASLRKVLQAIEWPTLLRAIESDEDLLIVAAYDPELYEGSDLLDVILLDRVELATRRLAWLEQARTALTRRDVSAMSQLLLDPPEGAPERLSTPERRRMRRMIEGHKALAELQRAVQQDDDSAVISALNWVERVGARISERKMWIRIQQVVERMSVIDELIAASESTPPDHVRMAQLIPTAKAMGLDRDPRLGGEHAIERLQEQVIQMAHVRRIQAAIERDNDEAIVIVAAPDPHGALDMMTEDERDRVALAIRNRRRLGRDTGSDR